jgi:molybdenum cofactor cytidylyltransferase
MKRLYAVILAAGSSRRLGTNKLTIRIDGEPVVRRSVTPFLVDGIEKVFVVAASAKVGAIEEALLDLAPHVQIIDNPHHAEGMSSSVKAALPLIEGADGVFFHLGDKPFVKREQVMLMIERYAREAVALLIPRYNGRKGHPVLMNVKPYLHEMRRLEGDKGLREIIEKHAGDVVFCDGDEGNIFDIDTVEEIETLKRRGYRIEES